MMEERSVDLLYLARNRLEFTRETFTTFLANTDWRYVHELFVYDDGSEDGTREWLEATCRQAPAEARFVQSYFGSPVAAMNDFITAAQAPLLAKTDNDAMLPPGWLRQSLEVLEAHPELSLLGIEAMYPHIDDPHLRRSFTPADFISGLGLYRRDAFAHSLPTPFRKWFGLEEWQMARQGRLLAGWITPALPVFLLDRFPFDPWKRCSDAYVQWGWQRCWPKYDPACTLWHWRWPGPPYEMAQDVKPERPVSSRASAGFTVVILSACASNLVPCIRSVLENEPAVASEDILVVDDGARAEAEPYLPGVRWVGGATPFVFARNANLGMRAAGSDVILLNDDARLVTPGGFTALARAAHSHPEIGVCSAAVRGVVGNPNQLATAYRPFRFERRTLAFICVYIPKAVQDLLGGLDERFTGYGFEDNDYCLRVLDSGLRLAITEECLVDHSGELPSTFRTRPDIWSLSQENRRLFREKNGDEFYARTWLR